MRSRLLLLVLGLAGCHTLDVSRAIALVPDESFGSVERQILGAAADCWNDELGVDLRVDRDADEDVTRGVLQQVRVGYLDFVCAFAAGRTENTLPVRISICPIRYMMPKSGASSTYLNGALFIVLTHELGHVLNILPHAEDERAVMASGGSLYPYSWARAFAEEDRALFREGNPDFVPRSRCPSGKVRIVAAASAPRCECP